MSDDRGYEILTQSQLSDLVSESRDFGNEVLLGLSERPRRLPSRYLYDDRGSELFQRIMAQEDYYPTDCERDIIRDQGAMIVERFAGERLDVIDLGAGDGAKAFVLLDRLIQGGVRARYRPIDISAGAMAELVAKARTTLPDLQVAGLVSEYADGLEWIASRPREGELLVLFLGSNIGNFDRAQARAFLRRLWYSLGADDHMLIGFDLKKDIETLLSAYNDRAGVTAEFNLNLLARINRELGADFDLSRFRHFATYDVLTGAMMSYLISLEDQEVRIEALSQSFSFRAWEPIHTEYSYKYLRSDIAELALATGFEIEAELTDDKEWFVDSLWRVEKATGA